MATKNRVHAKNNKEIRVHTVRYLEVEEVVKNGYFTFRLTVSSAQRVPEPDPLPGISFDTRPDPIQFWKLSDGG